MAKRVRPVVDCGTPELSKADLPGTAFLLAAQGRVKGGDPLVLARCAQRRAVIVRSRQRALKPRARAWATLRVVEAGGEFNDPASGAEIRAVETKDFVRRLLELLTPVEAKILRLRAEGVPFAKVSEELNLPLRTVEDRWARLRLRARLLLGA